MLIFEKASPDNTAMALQLGIKKAVELSTNIVLSTTTGASAVAAATVRRA